MVRRGRETVTCVLKSCTRERKKEGTPRLAKKPRKVRKKHWCLGLEVPGGGEGEKRSQEPVRRDAAKGRERILLE